MIEATKEMFPSSREALDPDKETSLAPDTYDAVICSAGFFQSLISPRALPEMIRITKKGN